MFSQHYYTILYKGLGHSWNLVSAGGLEPISHRQWGTTVSKTPAESHLHVLNMKHDSLSVKYPFEFSYLYLKA